MAMAVRRRVAGVCFVTLCLLPVRGAAQVPRVDGDPFREDLRDARRWMETGGYHAARQELERIFPHLRLAEDQRDVLLSLITCTFEDQEYEDAYRWAADFLREYPNDDRRNDILFIQGVAGFQTRRLEVAAAALTGYIAAEGDNPRRGAAYFWRAMCALDRGDWTSAEGDVRQCYNDSTTAGYHDIALLGWALALERHGSYRQAIDLLEKFLLEFPHSDLLGQAKIRLASLSLREGRPERAAQLLRQTEPDSRDQREEYLLLVAEADARLNRYRDAQSAYETFVDEFPDSRNARPVRYNLAWSRLKAGDIAGARREYDSLGRGNDSIAFASLYQSGVIALLEEKPNDALVRFDSLVTNSPYDDVSEKAYYEMGMARYRARYYKDARRYFQLAARMFPGSPGRVEAYRMLGEASVALSDYSNAQYAFSQVRRLNAPARLLAPAMFQEGVCLYHLGRFKSSADMFSRFLAMFPGDPRSAEGRVWAGEALYQDYRFPEAERAFADAMRLPTNPKRADALYGIAWSQFEQKKFLQAASAFEQFGNDFKNDGRALEAALRRADCYFFQGQYEKARAMYDALASARTDSRTIEYSAFQSAMSYIQRGESDRGIQQLRNFLARYPLSVYAEIVQFNIGWEYFSKERYSEAIPELRAVMQKYPYSQLLPRVMFNLGDAFYNLKQYDSARVYYQNVIREYPSSLLVPDALNGLQFTYEAEGRPAGALAQIDSFLTSNAVTAPKEELVFRKGSILFEQKDFDGAIRQYLQVLSMKPDRSLRARTMRELARSYEMQNDPARAIGYYRQILAEPADSEFAPPAALALGIADIKVGDYRDAASVLGTFDQSYQNSPLLTEARYYRGVALAKLPRKDEAMEQFLTIIKEHEGDVFADRSRLQIAQLLHDRGAFRPAIDTLTGLVSRRSDDIAAEALLMIGQNFLSLKKNTDALQAFNDVIRQYADYPLVVERARLGLGDAYDKLHERKRAREAYEEVARSALDPAVKRDARARLDKVRR